MTDHEDDRLAEELTDTLRAIADSYTSTVVPGQGSSRRRTAPVFLLAAAVVALLAGVAFALASTSDDAADLDTRENPTVSAAPAPSSTVFPSTVPSSIVPSGMTEAVLYELAGTDWVLDAIEIAGELVENGENETIGLSIDSSILESAAPQVGFRGRSGCDFATRARWREGGVLEWMAPLDVCDDTITPYATAFRERLTDTTLISRANLSPLPSLELTGDDVRILLVPAIDEPPCADIMFTPATEDAATRIVATLISCDVANELIATVAAGHNFYSGPRSFEIDDFSCTVETEDDGLPVGHYTCSNGDATITWDKT